MKKLKSGFTLAEVLITLAIIGIISAIILPSVMSNYQYKSIGVKLGKFVSTVEGSARAFVVNDDSFADEDAVTNFVNETFIFKSFEDQNSLTEYLDVEQHIYNSTERTGMTSAAEYPVALLKDGTGVRFALDNTEYRNTGDTDHHLDLVPVEKYGAPVFRIDFNPNVQGLPITSQKVFSFTVTELGYVFPHENDNCTWDLYTDDFNTSIRAFANGTRCHVAQNAD